MKTSICLPKVSIIIPTFNRASMLGNTVSSAMQQDYPNLEILICDNASTDDTENVAKNFLSDSRVQYFRNEANIGMVGNWRKALYERATGEWFLILSDDDWLIDHRYISDSMSLAKTDSGVSVVYAGGYIWDEKRETLKPLDLPFQSIIDGRLVFLSRGRVKPQDFTLCNILFRKLDAINEDAFSDDYNLACDSELFLRLCLRGSLGIIHRRVSIYRLHDGNLVNHMRSDFKSMLGYANHLIMPYVCAKQARVLTSDELRKFVIDSGLKRVVQITLVDTILFYRDHYTDLRKTFNELVPDVLNKCDNTLMFRLEIMLAKWLPLTYHPLYGAYISLRHWIKIALSVLPGYKSSKSVVPQLYREQGSSSDQVGKW